MRKCTWDTNTRARARTHLEELPRCLVVVRPLRLAGSDLAEATEAPRCRRRLHAETRPPRRLAARSAPPRTALRVLYPLSTGTSHMSTGPTAILRGTVGELRRQKGPHASVDSGRVTR